MLDVGYWIFEYTFCIGDMSALTHESCLRGDGGHLTKLEGLT